MLENLSNKAEFSGIKFFKVDVDEQPEISQEVGIRAVRYRPSLLVEMCVLINFADANVRRFQERGKSR